MTFGRFAYICIGTQLQCIKLIKNPNLNLTDNGPHKPFLTYLLIDLRAPINGIVTKQ